MYSFKFQNGDYFWDKDNRTLIQYGITNSTSLVISHNQCLAMPIPLSEGLLKVLGFTDNGKAEYENNDGVTIVIDGKNPDSILILNGKPIFFVCDLQHENIRIDRSQLQSYCENTLI